MFEPRSARWMLLLLVASSSLSATTFNFSAVVSSANIGSFASGQTVQGSLTFNPFTPGMTQADGTISYAGSISSFQLAGLTLSGTVNQSTINILPYAVSGFEDVFDARLGSAFSTLELYLGVFKNTGTLGNGALPTVPPSLAAFQDSSAFPSTYVQLADFSNGYQHIDANLTSLTAVAVPEPNALVLMGVSFVGGAVVLRRRGVSAFVSSKKEKA